MKWIEGILEKWRVWTEPRWCKERHRALSGDLEHWKREAETYRSALERRDQALEVGERVYRGCAVLEQALRATQDQRIASLALGRLEGSFDLLNALTAEARSTARIGIGSDFESLRTSLVIAGVDITLDERLKRNEILLTLEKA